MAIDKSQRFAALVRLGYAARGLTYLLLGMLALSTNGQERAGAQGVFDYLQNLPLGSALLWVIALGLLAYGLYRLIAGASNLENHAADAKGAAARIGEIASGVIHLFLAYTAYRFATGAKASASGGDGAMAQPVMDLEMGAILLGVGGIGMLAAAAMQAKHAATGDFMRGIAARAPRAVEAVGRAGHVARAVVFAVVGWSLLRAAWSESEGTAKGLGEALLSLRDNGVVFTLVAVGLLMFGAFSLVTARYRIIPDIDRSDLKPRLQ